MASEWEIKRQICEIGRRMYRVGFVAANDGNISVRLGGGHFLFTPTGVSKGFLTPDMLCLVDETGRQISGQGEQTSETPLHLEIYREVPEINAVVHGHPPHATAFAVAGMDLPSCILPEVEVFIGQVPLAEYDTPGTLAFAKTVLPHLRNKANTILLANHGAVGCDTDLEKAYFHLETLDMYCKILLLSKQVGNIQQLPTTKVHELLEIKRSRGLADPRLDDETQLCTLAGSDEFLRGFSTQAIPQHTPDADGHGRGHGIEGLDSQAGQPQPLPAPDQTFPAVVAGRSIPGAEALGGSSTTARQRAAEDEIERLVQWITDRIVQATEKS